MRITIMNASPKGDNSTSKQLIDRLIPFLGEDEYGILHVNPNMDEKLALTAANLSDAWIIVSPIYISGLPSSMTALMDLLEAKAGRQGVKVAAILQSGFYEKENCQPAMELIQYWCRRNGYTFAGGFGLGGGSALQGMTKVKTGKSFLKPLRPAYQDLMQALRSGEEKENFFSIGMSKWFYVWMAERQWKKQIHAQGLETKDLAYQPKDTNENFSKNN